jgi:hypothetical protein
MRIDGSLMLAGNAMFTISEPAFERQVLGSRF